jgi:nitrate reductase assembly molybdenum cofactor insertion protein NarJ
MDRLPSLAEAMSYPSPARLEALTSFAGAGVARSWSLGEWEEHYTRVFDLNPPSAPYLGYQVYGDRYQRGGLMAALGKAQRDAGIDTGGELPDHVAPVFSYLAAAAEPLPQLLEILLPGLEKIRGGVKELAPDSPYLAVLDEALATARTLSVARLPEGSVSTCERSRP